MSIVLSTNRVSDSFYVLSSDRRAGAVGLARGTYQPPNSDARTLQDTGTGEPALFTAYASSVPSGATALAGRFFLISGMESALTRFELTVNRNFGHRRVLSAGFFLATWDSVAGWQARNDKGAAESFTPLSSDVVIAIGYRSSSSDGIDSLKSLVPDHPPPSGIRYGEGVMDLVFRSDVDPLVYSRGDLRVSRGTYRLPDGTERRVSGNEAIKLETPFGFQQPEGQNNAGRFFLVSGAESAVDRFSLTFEVGDGFRSALTAGFFVATWTQSGGWHARNHSGATESFTPQDSDVVVAIGHAASAGSSNSIVNNLQTLVPSAESTEHTRMLAVDASGSLFRLELGDDMATEIVHVRDLAPIQQPSDVAHVEDGVALVADGADGYLHRVRYGESGAGAITDLGNLDAGVYAFPSVEHIAPGVALAGSERSGILDLVEYGDTDVAGISTLGAFEPIEGSLFGYLASVGIARIGDGEALVVIGESTGKGFTGRYYLYRVEYTDTALTAQTNLGELTDSLATEWYTGEFAAYGLAHLVEGVAVVSSYNALHRVEYTDTEVTSTTNIGTVPEWIGIRGLSALPSVVQVVVNTAPQAVDDSAETTEGVAVLIDVLANDSDADGDALTVASVTQPTNGATAIQTDGSIAYTPTAGFTGEDSFSYTISDGADQATANVTVTVDERPLAIYDPDTNTVTVSQPGLDGDRYEIEETFNGVVTLHHTLDPDFSNSSPESGDYVYRIRSCSKQGCDPWSRLFSLTVAVPDMFTDEPQIEADTVPGSLPYDVGVTKGGHAYVNVPVRPAPGVNGLAPRLSIDYSGGRERQRISDRLPGDMLGYGWRVSGLSTIRRCLKNRGGEGVIDFSTTDGLCLDGEPLVRIAGEPFAAGAEYRTYRESFARIFVRIDAAMSEPWFEVRHADDRTLEYGNTEDSRLHLVTGGLLRTEPLLWSVNLERDAFGNEMTYHYHEDEASGVRHPLRIEYGSEDDAEIRFRYAARQDMVSASLGDRMRSENLLLHTVEARLGGRPVREYRLVSETTAEGWRRLDRLQLCGYDERGSTADCLVPMDFDWMAPETEAAGFTTCVERFSDPLGRVTAFEHKTITDEGVQFTERPFGEPATPDAAVEDNLAKPVVTAMERGNGTGRMHRTEYAYHGKGFLSELNWGFLGFYSTRITDKSSGVVTYLQYRLDRPHYARVSAVHQYDRTYDPDDSAVEILSKRLTFHRVEQIGTGLQSARFVPYARRQSELFYEGGVELGAEQTVHSMTFDENGLLTRTVRTTTFGPGSLGSDNQPAGVWGGVPAYEFDAGSKLRVITSTHDMRNRMGTDTDGRQWLVGFPCRAVLEEKSPGTPLRRRWTAYTPHGESLNIGTAVRFGATSNADCPMDPMDPVYAADANLELTHSYEYDTDGNLTSTTIESTGGNVPRRQTGAASFADDRYPQQLTNAAGHVETRTYDARFGLPKSTTDPNGQTVSREYDPFGREVRYTTQDGVAIGTRYLWCGEDMTCDPVDNVDPVMAVETDSAISPRTVTYLDRLGRRLRTETESFDGLAVNREDILYDARGRVSLVSAPYKSRGSSDTAEIFETEYDYDIRDRVDKLNRADGGEVQISRLACGGQVQETAKETVYDVAGASVATRTRVSRYNLMGELVRVTEGGGTASAGCSLPAGLTDEVTTAYTYNGSGLSTAVTVGGHEVVAYDYDAAGYRLWAKNDDFGRVDFTHTALGEMRTRQHSKASGAALPGSVARPITYVYDVLGRLVTATERVSAGSSHWEYDGATNGVGLLSRRCRMPSAAAVDCGSTAEFDATYAYNADSRLSYVTTAIASGATTRTYTQGYGYDTNGRLETVSHPSGLTARREYNVRGYLSRLSNDADSTELIAYTDRDAWGNATGERLGNGALVSRRFEAASGRQTRQDVRLRGKLRHDAQYGWRSDGLLKRRSIRGVLDDGASTGHREESFVHDGLGRLKTAAATSGHVTRTLTTSYDALGNILSRTSSVDGDVDVTGYDYARALNAVQHATVGDVRHNYTYDRTGRLTWDRQCRELTGTCTFKRRTETVDDRHIAWDARGLPERVILGGGPGDPSPTARETFRHGPDAARFERLSEWQADDGTESARTFYLGAYEQTFLESDPDVVSVERTRLPGGVAHVRTTPAEGAATEAFEYRHLDHLGSTSVVSDATAVPLAVLGHDPFGGRRRADWTRELTEAESAELSGRRTARGFTGHEHLERAALVHTNGRLYDPKLGRFLSPDPYVTDTAMGQDWNGYSYVSNSPLSYVDPTGNVRAGPRCNSLTVICAAPDAGGGFTRTAQGYVHRGSIAITLPIVTVAWGPVFGGGGYHDYGYGSAGLTPRFSVSFLTFQVPFIVRGLIRVDGENPADEPMFSSRDAASIGVGVLPGVGTVQSIIEVISGYDYIADEEVHRGVAAAGIFAGVLPGGKAVLKAGTKVAGKAGPLRNTGLGSDPFKQRGAVGDLRNKSGQIDKFKGRDALRRENKMARDAARRAGLNRDQRDKLHREISSQNLSYHEILEVAQDIKAGRL